MGSWKTAVLALDIGFLQCPRFTGSIYFCQVYKCGIIPKILASRPMARQPKTPRMLTHGQIWTALDRLAERSGLSPSGLAKSAGRDPTTFNKSKRITADGRERWPSTESVAKALAATNSSIDTFVQLIGDGARGLQSVPLLDFAQAGAGGYFDDGGFPAGKGWDEVG